VRARRPVGVHLAALETFAIASASPEELGKVGCAVRPGDLVVLQAREAPRVRVVLDVGTGSDGGKVVMFDPDAKDGVRAFLASRVPTLAWEVIAGADAVAS
jgi:hypothetical protein